MAFGRSCKRPQIWFCGFRRQLRPANGLLLSLSLVMIDLEPIFFVPPVTLHSLRRKAGFAPKKTRNADQSQCIINPKPLNWFTIMYNYIWKENQHKAKINMCYLWKTASFGLSNKKFPWVNSASNHSKNGSFKNYHFVKISQNSKSRAKESRIECVLITQSVNNTITHCVINTMCYATKCNHVPISNPIVRWNFSSIKDSIFLASTDRLLAALAESNTDKMNSLGVHGSNLKKEAKGGEVTLGGQLHRRSAPEVEIWGGETPVDPSGLDLQAQHGQISETRFLVASGKLRAWCPKWQTLTPTLVTRKSKSQHQVRSGDEDWRNTFSGCVRQVGSRWLGEGLP